MTSCRQQWHVGSINFSFSDNKVLTYNENIVFLPSHLVYFLNRNNKVGMLQADRLGTRQSLVVPVTRLTTTTHTDLNQPGYFSIVTLGWAFYPKTEPFR